MYTYVYEDANAGAHALQDTYIHMCMRTLMQELRDTSGPHTLVA
jgi:hypothetical protein